MKRMTYDTFQSLLHIVEEGRKVSTVTLIAGPPQADGWVGQMLMVFADGSGQGTIGDSVLTGKILGLAADQPVGRPSLFSFEYNGDSYRCFLDIVAPKPRAVIFGGGHISQPLTEILALLDFTVVVVDDRPEFANSRRFPRAERVICDSFAKAGAVVEIDSNTAVIIVTRGHRYDLECLQATLPLATKYLGMIGSRRRVKALLASMVADGISPKRIKEVRSPIGLDIGAQTPAEIAVSIVAEIVSVFKGVGVCCSLSDEMRQSHG